MLPVHYELLEKNSDFKFQMVLPNIFMRQGVLMKVDGGMIFIMDRSSKAMQSSPSLTPDFSRLGQGRTLNGQSKERVLRALNHFLLEERHESCVPNSNSVIKRFELATEMGSWALKKIISEDRSGLILSHKWKRIKNDTKTVTLGNMVVIRDAIFSCYERKIFPSPKRRHEWPQQFKKVEFRPDWIEKIWRTVKEMDFKYVWSEKRARKVMMETENIVCLRRRYIREIRKFRAAYPTTDFPKLFCTPY